jgi:hypothetical protein
LFLRKIDKNTYHIMTVVILQRNIYLDIKNIVIMIIMGLVVEDTVYYTELMDPQYLDTGQTEK